MRQDIDEVIDNHQRPAEKSLKTAHQESREEIGMDDSNSQQEIQTLLPRDVHELRSE